MRSIEIGANVPAFLGKLWKMVNDSETNDLISWSPDGKTFVINNQADFARELLPLYYKHNNMASFIRQLNMYGFHKITSVENGGLKYEKDEMEFMHPCFVKGKSYLLEHIKRKIAIPKSVITSSEGGEKLLIKPEIIGKVLADVKQMKGKQESLDEKFSAMKQENEALWREVAILRQKHLKQQHIVNNLIQFLMSVVQPSRSGSSRNDADNIGVKRPYQLMINSSAHNSNDSYPGKRKARKILKDDFIIDLNEDNQEDGPTIHELVHDDMLPTEGSEQTVSTSTKTASSQLVSDANCSTNPLQYHVTMEDGDDTAVRVLYPICTVDEMQNEALIETIASPNTPLTTSISALDTSLMEQLVNCPNKKSNTKSPKLVTKRTGKATNSRSLLGESFNQSNPSSDLRLPTEIFASDGNDNSEGVSEQINISTQINDDPLLAVDPMKTIAKDKMVGGINIKVENNADMNQKAHKSNKNNMLDIEISNIKTEARDEAGWNTMSLATINNNSLDKFQTVTDIDDHLDTMQSDLDSLRDLLKNDSYSLDTNTLLGLFNTDDPLYGLSFPMDDRMKSPNNAEGNELISYTEIPDFDISALEADNAQDGYVSPRPGSSTLNTPQIEPQTPSYPNKL